MDGSFRSHGPYTAGGGGGGLDPAYDPAYDDYDYDDADADADATYPRAHTDATGYTDDVYADQRADILKLVLYDLNSAIAPREIRLMAIHAALEEFDHDDEPLHDEELELRADHILLQKLTYALSLDPGGMEVGYVLSAMEAVYRAGRTRLAVSFHEICDALLPLFVEMLRPPAGWSAVSSSSGKEGEGGASTGAGEANGTEGGGGYSDADGASSRSPHHAPPPPSTGMDFDPALPRTSYGEYDEESAESVEIPQPHASEYYDRMGSAASSSHHRRDDEGDDDDGGTISPVTAPTEGNDDSARDGGGGASTIPSEFGRPIPPGTGEYFEEMQQRRNGSGSGASDSDAGGVAGAARGRMPGADLDATADNTLVPHPMNLDDVGEGALVPVPGGGTHDHERIRRELQAAREAMGAGQATAMMVRQLSVEAEGATHQGNPLAIEGGTAEAEETEELMHLRGGGAEGGDEDESNAADDFGDVLPTSQYDPEESQDNPFSDTSSFRNSVLSSEYGGAAFREGHVGSTHGDGHDHDDGDNPFSDASSFKGYGGGSGGGYDGAAYGEERGGEEANDNPFSEAGDPLRGRTDEMSESTPRRFNLSLNSRPTDASAPEPEPDHQRGAAGFDEQGGFNGGAPQIFAGFDDDDEEGQEEAHGVNSEGQCSDHGPHGSHAASDGRAGPDEASASQGVFDEHGGYSGAAPQIFPGYDDAEEEQGMKDSFTNGGAASEGRFDHSERSGPSYDPSGTEYTGTEGDPSQYSPGRGSSSRGYDGINRHFGKQHSEGSAYTDDPHARRQSDITDEWGDDSMRSGGPRGELGGLGETLPPEPRPYPDASQASEEAKYPDYPYEDGGDHPPHGVVHDEDIFHFQEPRPSAATAHEEYHTYSDPVDAEVCPLAVRKALKILRYFSRVLSAMEPLAQQHSLVDALLYHMTRRPRTDEYEEEVASRVDAIAVVVNLACAEENKIMLVYHPGLLDAVITIANHDPIDEAREHAAIVLMNLAYAEENKVHMVNQDHLLDTLVHLLSDVSPFTRRYASAALFTLACTYANTAVMARHCDGGILEALRKVLLNDPIDEARVNAAEALFNMARNNSDDTVENMGNHPRLLASLAHSVLTDYSADVRAYSARALEWLSADIHHPLPCHRILLKALTTASQWTKTTCIAEALKMQASLSENRKAMVEHPGLLDALATLSLLDGITDDEVKTCAISAIERLSKEASTRHIMVTNEGIMTALTKATFAKDGVEDDAPDEGTPTALLMKTALKNLAEHM